MDIEKYNFNPKLLEYLKFKKINKFTKVQEEVFKKFTNKNLIVESQTGSGKTLAFLLPILNNIVPSNGVQAIIFVPTRELGEQIWNVLKEIEKFLPEFNSLKLLGGRAKEEEIKKIEKLPNIIIATSERILKILEKSKVDFSNLKNIIVDESDMMLDFGFFDNISFFKNKFLKNEKNYNISFFSATLNKQVEHLIKKQINFQFEIINIEKEKYFKINRIITENKFKSLVNLINSDKFNPYFCLVFTKSNIESKEIFSQLKKEGIKNISYFSSDLIQRERKKIINQIKNDEIIYLITTDLISRGMDFNVVSHIINYSLPVDLNYYTHRIGRTNRNNNISGKIFDFYDLKDEKKYDNIYNKNKNLVFQKYKI